MSDLSADEARRAAEWPERIGEDWRGTQQLLHALVVELAEVRDDAHEQRAYLAHYRRKGVADDAELARLRATPTLTPVGEHPEPGTRGLLPVVMDDGEWGSPTLGMFLCAANSVVGGSILADPRPGGAE